MAHIKKKYGFIYIFNSAVRWSLYLINILVRVCVCVCVREREREIMFGIRERHDGENWSVKSFIVWNILNHVIGFVFGYTFPLIIFWDLEDKSNKNGTKFAVKPRQTAIKF